jgi:glyoxylate reductase
MLGHRVNGKVLGIIGMGRIGRAIARRALGFGIRVIYHNRHRLPEGVEAELGARFADLDTLFSQSDIVSVNCPHTPETHHLVNAHRLSQMRPDAYFVNTARGDIVDESALIEALEQGRIAGAGLDVYADEPDIAPALLALPNTVFTPHMAGRSPQAQQAQMDLLLANLQACFEGRALPTAVN